MLRCGYNLVTTAPVTRVAGGDDNQSSRNKQERHGGCVRAASGGPAPFQSRRWRRRQLHTAPPPARPPASTRPACHSKSCAVVAAGAWQRTCRHRGPAVGASHRSHGVLDASCAVCAVDALVVRAHLVGAALEAAAPLDLSDLGLGRVSIGVVCGAQEQQRQGFVQVARTEDSGAGSSTTQAGEPHCRAGPEASSAAGSKQRTYLSATAMRCSSCGVGWWWWVEQQQSTHSESAQRRGDANLPLLEALNGCCPLAWPVSVCVPAHPVPASQPLRASALVWRHRAADTPHTNAHATHLLLLQLHKLVDPCLCHLQLVELLGRDVVLAWRVCVRTVRGGCLGCEASLSWPCWHSWLVRGCCAWLVVATGSPWAPCAARPGAAGPAGAPRSWHRGIANALLSLAHSPHQTGPPATTRLRSRRLA
jgi:hypothetical protein